MVIRRDAARPSNQGEMDSGGALHGGGGDRVRTCASGYDSRGDAVDREPGLPRDSSNSSPVSAWLFRRSLALFLITLAASAFVQLRDGREEALVDAINDIDIIATLSAAKVGSRPAPVDRAEAATHLNDFARELAGGALARGRTLLLVDRAGSRAGEHTRSARRRRGRSTICLGDAQPLTLFADRAGVMTIRLVDRRRGHRDRPRAPRLLRPDRGRAAARSRAHRLAGAHHRPGHAARRSPSSSAVIGVAYVMQANRARAADEVCEKVRDRIDSALNRGRCGLWDWDIARGRIYWSDSMYELLGYERRDEFLSFGEVNAMVHPEDQDLYAARQPARLARSTSLVDHEFRIRASPAIGSGCAPARS